MITDFPKTFALLALGCGTLLVTGCVDKSSPDTLDKRSVERWNYLIAHQAEKAYDFLTPGYRSTQTRDEYAGAMNNRPVLWKQAVFEDKQCEGDRCTVSVTIDYSMPIPGTAGKRSEAKSTQHETWLRVDGQWYYLPSN